MQDPIFKNMLVLELASVLAGPSVGQFFAELGAQVIKVENAATGGDVTRTWKLPTEPADTDTPAYFCAANWGKESFALDLLQEEDLAELYALVKLADIVIASYKPGDAEKLQVDYDTLKSINPHLIYGHITGYGPGDARAGYDAVVQAESGFMYLNGEPDGPPTKMPVALMDLLTAHQLKEGLLVALLQRERTGQGSLVQVSLLESAISALANQGTNYLVAGYPPKRMGSEHPTIVPYGSVYTTQDGKQLVLAVGDDRQFRRLCRVLGVEDFALDERYSTNYNRVRHREEVNEQLRPLILQWERNTLLQHLHALHVPAGAVNTVPDVFQLPQAQSMLLQREGVKPGIRQVAFKLAWQEHTEVSPPPSYKDKRNSEQG
ncbi:crotonobetainyl-CoA:carnitine CoA-transferase CaiB-like acyl-CoA transferase [Pontibacter ummariensis]|uniref:Crotonobetainyl-CoA:carnitine CoA-transferase CaiB n=1 Tax=Pontibacter ummariensis TaxID=1610492 RepID=A0A239EZH0_9BACT|nr:CaiB/BaiF CoA-transferase family protein [Pontibacter ummariensis]PRY12668.1 crotonobetainyl-CoA:carnitine CoA-transferase CaiB-like acyl-CoA transferase [Pontibacter ummariensis]SNS50029.1 Crotonobetainyl-CoA:carnitine CoA-transferase CaiB [Pontibacter ummariensis]